jgi:hypothetical protein
VTFSVPFVSSFYFLSAALPEDTIRYGVWGFCLQQSGQCTTKTLGYHSDPEIIFWLTKVLVLFPIGAIASFDSRSQNADGSLSGDIHVPASAGYSPFCHLSRSTRYYIPASDIQSSCYTSGAHIASCVCIHDRVIYCRKNEIPRCRYQCSLWTPGTSILYFSPAIFAVSY